MSLQSIVDYQAIIQFWFEEIENVLWFKKDADFDQLIKDRFETTYAAATRCELFVWRENALGRLAEIIVLDQFSRNMFRDSYKAFQFDSLALALAQQAVAQQIDNQLSVVQRKFLYMPYMHSESLIIHQQSKRLFAQPGLEDNYQFELKHLAIIERFGRYPHRNALLNRESTDEEKQFLTQPGSKF